VEWDVSQKVESKERNERNVTLEPIKCLSKVLDGTPIACRLGIGGGPHVVFKVSFGIAIMSMVLNFKS
jgi:hypothetical protein